MSLSSDYICVWIEDAIVYAGIKRIYDYDKNSGYIIKKFGDWDDDSLQKDAILLAVSVSELSGLPFKTDFRDSQSYHNQP